MCDISFHVGIVCSLNVSHGVVRTVFQSTLQLPFSLLDGALRRWGRHLLGWPSGSPNAAVFLELGWPDALHLCTERLLSLFGRALSMPSGERCPLPALIFRTALSFPGSWASHCVRLCNSLGVHHPNVCGIGPLSSAHCVQAWFQTHAAPLLNRFLRDRLVAAASLLSVCHVRVASLAVNAGPHQIVYGRSSIPSHARFWGLARWGHDPFPGGRAARHLGLSLSCTLCEDPSGDLFHCLSECSAFSDLRDQWCRQCSIHPDSVSFWARHPWLFLPSSSLNSVSSIRAHVSCAGQVCERFVSL